MIEIGMEHAPLVERLTRVLDREPDPVKQQIAIEFLAARHAGRVSKQAFERRFVIDSMRKHILQMLGVPVMSK
jgi:hypothetical protein